MRAECVRPKPSHRQQTRNNDDHSRASVAPKTPFRNGQRYSSRSVHVADHLRRRGKFWVHPPVQSLGERPPGLSHRDPLSTCKLSFWPTFSKYTFCLVSLNLKWVRREVSNVSYPIEALRQPDWKCPSLNLPWSSLAVHWRYICAEMDQS